MILPPSRPTAVFCRSILALCLLLLSVSVTQAREFRAADNQVEDYPTVQALQFMAKLVAERTKGRHTIRVFHSRQLGEERDTIDATKAGAIDLNRTNIVPLGVSAPSVNVLAMPFLFRSVEHLHKVLDSSIGSEILESLQTHGFVGLTFYDSGARSIYNNVRPIRSLADLKGLKIRVQQSELMVEMLKALGGEPIELSYGQVLTGLTTKLIDGAENNWPSYVTTGHYRHAAYYSLTEHLMAPEVLIMSQKAWAGLNDEDRRIFRDAARESNLFMRARWRSLEEDSRRQAEAAGIMVVDGIDRKPFEAAMAGLYAKAARDPATARMIERIRQIQ
ncbi:C4-dicarboxylate ABC transporter [Afipia sp. P52-10]|nr:C4-dicarboxylate ABC transporter [Afipia sp. P52-10]